MSRLFFFFFWVDFNQTSRKLYLEIFLAVFEKPNPINFSNLSYFYCVYRSKRISASQRLPLVLEIITRGKSLDR